VNPSDAPARDNPWGRGLWLSILVFIVGLLLSLSLWQRARERGHREHQAYFEYRSRDALTRVEQRLLAYENVLRGAAGLLSTTRQVSRQEFARYVDGLNLSQHFPGIQGVGFTVLLQPKELAKHQAAIRAEGHPDYTVRPAGERALYTSIVFLEPFRDRNLRAFGYDMFSEPIRRKAMERARDTGEIAMSGKVKLVQETDRDVQAGFLMYVPVYREGEPMESIEVRRRSLLGWAYAPLRMNDLMMGVLGEAADDLGIEIFDGREPLPEQLLFDKDPSLEAEKGSPVKEELLTFGGNEWRLRLRAQPGLERRIRKEGSPLVLVFGGITSLLIALLVWSLVRGRDKAIGEERSRLENILRGTNAGTWEWNVQTGQVIFNERWAEMLGYRLIELEPLSIQTWISLAHPEDLAQSEVLLNRHFSGELDYYEHECRMKAKHGDWVWVLDRGKVMTWTPDGKPLLMAGTHQDITAAKQAERALQESEKNFRALFESMDDLIFVANPEGLLRFTNAAVTRKLGYSREALQGMHLLEMHAEAHRLEATEIFSAMVRKERESCPLPLQTQEGRLMPADTRAWGGHWDGEPCIFGISKDLSQQEAARQKFDSLFQLNPTPMAVGLGANRTFSEVNQAFLSTLGYQREDLIGRTAMELGLWVDPETPMTIRRVLQQEGRVRNLELKLRHRDGKVLTGLFYGELIDLQGELALLSVMVDISERRALEEELRLLTKEQAAILENASIGITFVKDRKQVWCNARMGQLFGYRIEDMSMMNTRDFYANPEDFARVGSEGYVAIAANQAYSVDLEMKRSDGGLFWANIRGKALDSEDPSQGSIWSFDDITARVNAERRLEELNLHLNQRVAEEVEKNRLLDQVLVAKGRQAAMGEMIGHIAHQWRQPLSALALVISNIRDTHRFGCLSEEVMEQAREDSQRLIQKMSTTINDFMNFFQEDKAHVRFSIQEQARQAMALVGASFKHNGISLDLEGLPIEVIGHPNEFSQVLLNLLANAKESILETRSEGGQVHITSERVGSWGVLRLLDNGGGIPDSAMPRIFDPYFSTKEMGTGIGLYMSKTLVERGFHGRIEARNTEGGCEFSVWIPLALEAS